MYVLHFVKDKDRALENVIKLAQKGGVMIFSDLEDKEKVDPDYIKYLKENLVDVKEERFEIDDKPHAGYSRPHKHRVYVLIGTKK